MPARKPLDRSYMIYVRYAEIFSALLFLICQQFSRIQFVSYAVDRCVGLRLLNRYMYVYTYAHFYSSPTFDAA